MPWERCSRQNWCRTFLLSMFANARCGCHLELLAVFGLFMTGIRPEVTNPEYHMSVRSVSNGVLVLHFGQYEGLDQVFLLQASHAAPDSKQQTSRIIPQSCVGFLSKFLFAAFLRSSGSSPIEGTSSRSLGSGALTKGSAPLCFAAAVPARHSALPPCLHAFGGVSRHPPWTGNAAILGKRHKSLIA